MANHKRGKPKNARAGCLMCKPHKANGCNHERPHSEKKQILDDLTNRERPKYGE